MTLALVLGGGNALGAYHGGVAEALAVFGAEPDWVAGSSIGAVCCALIAGNPPDRRVSALRDFWRRSVQLDFATPWLPSLARAPMTFMGAVGARMFGRPRLFLPRLGPGPGHFSQAPMRDTLLDLVDWDRLNDGTMRLSALAVDLATGEEVVFDTVRERVTVDHVLASAALVPDFAPVRIGGRVLADGGLSANVPADLVLGEVPDEPLAVFVADLFPGEAPLPSAFADGTARQSDLIFARQTRRTLRFMQDLWALRADAPPGACYWIEYMPLPEEERPLKGYDFSQFILDHRWAQGCRDAQAALALWRAEPPTGRGLRIHSPIRAASARVRDAAA